MGTFGLLQSECFSCFMSELPWRNNEKTKSCIPTGLYEVRWHRSPKFGYVYKVFAVPNRSEILFHSGNYVGDVLFGYKSNSYGCLLPARKLGFLGSQRAGLMSSVATKDLFAHFNKEPFLLEIKNKEGIENVDSHSSS